ncbi:hypothetical protein FGIG_11997 [Fasciola gigantica]|uniref:CUB domain-containing protein n=1 Tax=Fasciola gigantica TaxID=46835 RepID=A0A504ZA39_FASGI|nr:hypothetical protein FGIG_11997 [Fasciola gigantica]
MVLRIGLYLFYSFSIFFNFVDVLAQSSSPNCGNQSLYLRNGQNIFFIPEHDGPRECVYNLTSENGTIINFMIVSLSIGTKKGKCDHDYITVGDSEKDLPHPRYTACGEHVPNWQLYSTGNRMTVKLVVKNQLKKVSVLADVWPLNTNRIPSPECGNSVIRVGPGRTELTFPPDRISLKMKPNVPTFYLEITVGMGA